MARASGVTFYIGNKVSDDYLTAQSEIRRRFDKIISLLDESKEMDKIFTFVETTALRVYDQAFETETDPVTGIPWADLADFTVKKKSKMVANGLIQYVQHPGILQETGALRKNLQPERESNWSRWFGIDLSYGGDHMTGEEGMPARPFLGLSTDAVMDIENVIKVEVGLILRKWDNL